jgi:adenine-specific DNA-methyltransferase
MHGVDAFEDEVAAYPAVVVLRNGPPSGTTAVEAQPSFGPEAAADLVRWKSRPRARVARRPSYEAARLRHWFDGEDLWPSGSTARLATLAELERRFPPLQDSDTGTRVGIGVASGCDDVFITTDSELVEEDRLLPLLRSADTRTGRPVWSGGYLVNPWDAAGLVDLDDYPLLRRYPEAHRDRLAARHVGRRTPAQWFRTIDRVDPALATRAKLVLPDLKAAAHPVLDEGDYYPHHNLYHVTSGGWDLEVLGGLLLSEVTNLFVGSYCVKMQGGCYRFQAQYLRRIRVPVLGQVKKPDARALTRAFADRDVEAATAVALRLYALDELP